MTNALHLERKAGGIMLIQFNRPERMNGLDNCLLEELLDIFNQVNSDEDIKCVVLTGGERVFCAGGDLNFLSELGQADAYRLCKLAQDVVIAIRNLNKPVIAAVGGPAIGGGLELALAADIMIASEGALFGLTQTNLGIIPGAGGTHTLIDMIGLNRTRYLIYSGDMINADMASEMGLITKVVPRMEVVPEAIKLAEKLAAKAPLALKMAKKNINRAANTDYMASLDFERQAWEFLFSTSDQQEGFAAFLEKRSPCFKGR